MSWDDLGGGGRQRSGDLVIGTSGDLEKQNLNSDDTARTWHFFDPRKSVLSVLSAVRVGSCAKAAFSNRFPLWDEMQGKLHVPHGFGI
jgi:hypothetical protein